MRSGDWARGSIRRRDGVPVIDARADRGCPFSRHLVSTQRMAGGGSSSSASWTTYMCRAALFLDPGGLGHVATLGNVEDCGLDSPSPAALRMVVDRRRKEV